MAVGSGNPESIFDSPVYSKARAHRIRNLQAHFDMHSLRGGRILEIGCGIGRTGAYFENAGCRVVSVDARADFINTVRKYYPHRETAVIDLDRWDAASLGRFDAVLCFGLLNHMAAPETLLAECTRLSDLVFLDTIVMDWPWPCCVMESCTSPDGSFGGIGCRPSPAWVSRLMDGYGFSSEDISSSLANWDGAYPGVYDWEPRNDGQWRHGNTFLRKMWICRRISPAGPPPTNLERISEQLPDAIVPELLNALDRNDLGGVRILEIGKPDFQANISGLGAAVTRLTLPDTARDGSPNGPPLWWQSGKDLFDVVVLHAAPGFERCLAALLHRVSAPLLLISLPPGGATSMEDALAVLNRTGYSPVRRKSGSVWDQPRSILIFEPRESTATALEPLLVHVHIHKCGGTSFNRLLEKSFGSRHVEHYPTDLAPFPTRDELKELVRARPPMTSLASHSIRVFPPIIGGRLPLYVAFLRHPLRRFLSHLSYVKRQFAAFPEWLRQQWPANCPDLSLREMAAWMLDRQPEAVRSGSLMTNFLTEQTWLDMMGGSLRLADRWLDRDSPLYRSLVPIKLDLATAVLEDFFFVGLVEEMETSMRCLREKLHPYGVHLADEPLPFENVSGELATGGWLNPADPVGKAALAFLDDDIALYRRFQGRVHSRWLV